MTKVKLLIPGQLYKLRFERELYLNKDIDEDFTRFYYPSSGLFFFVKQANEIDTGYNNEPQKVTVYSFLDSSGIVCHEVLLRDVSPFIVFREAKRKVNQNHEDE